MYTSYRDLVVWQRGMELAAEIYHLTKRLPASESFSLASQMQRAAVSIPSNIAEGHGRGSNKEFLRFLAIANGSCSELQTQLLLCEKIGYLTRKDTHAALLQTYHISKMIYALSHALR